MGNSLYQHLKIEEIATELYEVFIRKSPLVPLSQRGMPLSHPFIKKEASSTFKQKRLLTVPLFMKEGLGEILI